jgi:hypothetical protein
MMADSLLLGEVTSPRKRDQQVVFEDVEVKLTNRDKQPSVLLVTKMVNTSFIPVSSINKSDLHDITEILLKVALNTIKQTFTFYLNLDGIS